MESRNRVARPTCAAVPGKNSHDNMVKPPTAIVIRPIGHAMDGTRRTVLGELHSNNGFRGMVGRNNVDMQTSRNQLNVKGPSNPSRLDQALVKSSHSVGSTNLPLAIQQARKPKQISDKKDTAAHARVRRNQVKECVPATADTSVEKCPLDCETKGFSMFRLHGMEKLPFDEDFYYIPDYLEDIHEYLLRREKHFMLGHNHLKCSRITPRMRAVLVDWMVNVGSHFHLSNDTLHISVNLLDYFLHVNPTITRNVLQLAGITTLLLASKYEEIHPKSIHDFSSVTAEACSPEDIQGMENYILKIVKFEMGLPTALPFFRRGFKIASCSRNFIYKPKSLYYTGIFILELALTDYDACSFVPSLLAAGSLAMSLMINRVDLNLNEMWDENLSIRTQYSLKNMKMVIPALYNIVIRAMNEPNNLTSVCSKYNSSKYNYISSTIIRNLSTWSKRVHDQLQTIIK